MLTVRCLARNMRLAWSRPGNVLLSQPAIATSLRPKIYFLRAPSCKPKLISHFHRCACRIICCTVLMQNVLAHMSFINSYKPILYSSLAILATPMMVLRRIKTMSSRLVARRLVRRIPKMAPTLGAAQQQLQPTADHFLLMQKVCLPSGLNC